MISIAAKSTVCNYRGVNFYKPKYKLARTMDIQRDFFKKFELVGLGRHFGLKFFEAFEIYLARLSAPIWYFEFLVHVSTKKLLLYIHLGFEFGPQRI